MKNKLKTLEIYRLENRISQEKLAKELNVSFCTVNRWFNNRNLPNKIHDYHIEKLLKIKFKNQEDSNEKRERKVVRDERHR
ncbi:MAG: helix-turn-helix transcriptional regulator [Candidatus Goldbacteria bacterium]|nr:helix-turn-helix transcriptional regulator [Candidatus Goldiibacteriota bacterium]